MVKVFLFCRLLMENKLRNGTSLVVDRYSYSGVSFSAAKGLDVNWCKVTIPGNVQSLWKAACQIIFFLFVGSREGVDSSRFSYLHGYITRGTIIHDITYFFVYKCQNCISHGSPKLRCYRRIIAVHPFPINFLHCIDYGS